MLRPSRRHIQIGDRAPQSAGKSLRLARDVALHKLLVLLLIVANDVVNSIAPLNVHRPDLQQAVAPIAVDKFGLGACRVGLYGHLPFGVRQIKAVIDVWGRSHDQLCPKTDAAISREVAPKSRKMRTLFFAWVNDLHFSSYSLENRQIRCANGSKVLSFQGLELSPFRLKARLIWQQAFSGRLWVLRNDKQFSLRISFTRWRRS
jgi:hypothetical protein